MPRQARQLVVALARDQHDRPVRHVTVDAVVHPFDQFAIAVHRHHPSHFRSSIVDSSTIVAAAGSSAIALVPRVQVLAELRVVLQPPARGLRNHQVLRAVRAQPLQLRDARVAVRGIVPGVRAILTLREMPRLPPFEPQQLAVALADHRDPRAGRHGSRHELTDAADQLAIRGLLAPLVRLPRDAPLLLPPRAVRVEDRAVLPRGPEPADRRLPEVMHEHVLGADDAIARLTHAHRVVVVFEQADLEALVERSDRLPDLAPHRRAEHRHRPDVEQLARMRRHVRARERAQLAVGAIRGVDLGLVAGAIRHRPEQADPLDPRDDRQSARAIRRSTIVSLFSSTTTVAARDARRR